MTQPNIGDRVKLYPAPLPRHKDDDGPVRARLVSDGPGGEGEPRLFLPAAGAERAYSFYWHERLLAGDVLLMDPTGSYEHAATTAPAKAAVKASAAPAPADATAPVRSRDKE